MGFFGILSAILAIIALCLFIPIFVTYINIGKVPKFPTLFMSGFIMLAAIQALFSGMILQTITEKNRQDFEMELQHAKLKKEEH